MSSETTTLARFVAGLNFEDVPRDVIERTQFLIMDHVGIALRARYAADLNEAMNGALTGLGFTGGVASVIGDSQNYAPPAAAFYNGNPLISTTPMPGVQFIPAPPSCLRPLRLPR